MSIIDETEKALNNLVDMKHQLVSNLTDREMQLPNIKESLIKLTKKISELKSLLFMYTGKKY